MGYIDRTDGLSDDVGQPVLFAGKTLISFAADVIEFPLSAIKTDRFRGGGNLLFAIRTPLVPE